MVDSRIDCPTWCAAQDPGCKNYCNARSCSRYPAPSGPTDCPSLAALGAELGLVSEQADALAYFGTSPTLQLDATCTGPGRTSLSATDHLGNEVEFEVTPGRFSLIVSLAGIGQYERLAQLNAAGNLEWLVEWQAPGERLARVVTIVGAYDDSTTVVEEYSGVPDVPSIARAFGAGAASSEAYELVMAFEAGTLSRRPFIATGCDLMADPAACRDNVFYNRVRSSVPGASIAGFAMEGRTSFSVAATASEAFPRYGFWLDFAADAASALAGKPGTNNFTFIAGSAPHIAEYDPLWPPANCKDACRGKWTACYSHGGDLIDLMPCDQELWACEWDCNVGPDRLCGTEAWCRETFCCFVGACKDGTDPHCPRPRPPGDICQNPFGGPNVCAQSD